METNFRDFPQKSEPSKERTIERQVRILKSDSFVEFQKEDIEQSIPERFRQQVQQYPHKIAIKETDREISYDQLDRLSHRIAAVIIEKLTDPEDTTQVPIALLFEPGIMAIAAVLGTLKAGQICVPLDASLPQSRLRYILEDSQTMWILTNPQNFSLAQEIALNSNQVLNLDEDLETDADVALENLRSPDRLAYILYTSGSTGKPKGVVQNHRNVLFNVRLYTNLISIGSTDRFSLQSSYSNGAGLTTIFRALLNGATLCPFNLPQEGVSAIADWLMREKITIYQSVPTVFRYFVNTLTEFAEFPHLRIIHLGGELVSIREIELYKKYFSRNCILMNHLSSTEVGSFGQYLIDRGTQLTGHIVPIFCNLEDKAVILLDEEGKEVGDNCIGEITVTSRYLALGYWQKPELTQEKFFQTQALDGTRTYHTGDLGRKRPDGSIEFLGRKDFQVKIRGFRIELGEIETILAQHPHVEDVAVNAQEHPSGEQYLVAYIIPNSKVVSSVDNLRQFLRNKLPDYMIPAAFVPLEALPLNPNGKIDRQSLPAPDWQQQTPAPFGVPRNESEFRLVRIWKRVLGLKFLSIHDNFFDVGGNSLLAASVLADVESKFGQKLPLSTLLEAPTVEALAYHLEHPDSMTSSRSLVPLKPTGSKPPFFYVHPRSGSVLLFGNLARYLDPERPLYGLQAVGLNGEREPLTRIEDMAAHYIQEIQTIQPNEPYLLGGRCLGGIIALEMAQQLLAQGQQVLLVVLVEAPRSGIADPVLARQIRSNMERMRELNSHQANHLSAVLDANDRAGRDYQPRVYPGRMAYFYAEETWHDPSLGFGWANLALGGLDIYKVPGTHMTISDRPNVRILADKLSLCLDWAQIQPETPNLHTLLGNLQRQQGDLSGATAHYQKAIDLEPQNPWVHKNLGDLLLQQGQFEDAISAYQKAQELQPENLTHSLSLIKALLKHGDVDRTIAICHQTLELTPDYPDLYCQLGLAYRQKGEIEDAIASFQKAIQIDPQSVVAYRNLGEILVEQEQFSQAITLYQSAIEFISDHPNLYISLGTAQKKNGNLDEAIASYQQALDLSPHPNFSIYRNLGDVWKQKGQLFEAISAYQKAIVIQPERSELYRLLGNSQAEQGDTEGAIFSYQKAINLNPQQPARIYKKLGDLLCQQNRTEAALLAYQEAHKLQPQNQGVRKILEKLELGNTKS